MLDFVLFAFLVNLDSPLRQHIGWYADAAACHAVVRRLNDTLPHERGVVGRKFYVCRCFSCGKGWG